MTVKVKNAKTTSDLIEIRVARIREELKAIEGDDNPCVVRYRNSITTELNTLETVYESLHGSHALLKIT